MSDPLEQSGGKYTRNSKTGLRRVDRVYNVASLAVCDSFVLPNSDNPLGLREIERNATELAEGDWQLTVTLEGAPDGADLGEAWEINFASEQKPIQAFPQWEAFAKQFGAEYDLKDRDKLTGFARKIKIGGSFVKNPAWGLENYLCPKAILTVEFNARTLDRTIWRNLGKIDTPRQPANFQLPELDGNRNWLKHSAIPIDRGSIVGHRVVWWLSDEGGWLQPIYAPRR